jgi:hypothetical protein
MFARYIDISAAEHSFARWDGARDLEMPGGQRSSGRIGWRGSATWRRGWYSCWLAGSPSRPPPVRAERPPILRAPWRRWRAPTPGRAALALVALGLVAHAAFRGALVVVGEPYVKRGPVGRVVRRIVNGFGVLIYAGLAVTAGALTMGWGAHVHTNKDAETRHLSARILTTSFGRPLLIGVALGIAVAAIVQLVRAFGPNHVREQLRVGEMSELQRRTVVVLARIAFAARGIVLAVCGYFVARAAIDGAPREARGPAGALRAVGELPHGRKPTTLVPRSLASWADTPMFGRWRRKATAWSLSSGYSS